MKITDLLKKESVLLEGHATDKKDALHTLVGLMAKQGNVADVETYEACVLKREEEGSTGVGEGVAIPHAKTSAVTRPGLAFMRCLDGVEFDSLDGQPAKLFFLIAAPDSKDNVHLDVLSRLSTLLMDPDFINGLMAVTSEDELFALITKAEAEKFADEEPAEEATPAVAGDKKAPYQVLAVTACPTGIAHTYMAAESLEQHAAKKGISIKVETNGQSGIKHALTAEEIEGAEGIIVAADKYVPMNRFKGKRVVIVKVADGINKADALLDEALSGKVPIFEGETGGSKTAAEEAAESGARKIYKHLMDGVSHMLPFVIGGIMAGALASAGGSGFFGALIGGFAAGYLILLLKKLVSGLPQSLESLKPILIYPVIGLLLIGALMAGVINPVMASFNQWVTGSLAHMGGTSKVLMGFILGGMMSIDFGGPLNKAAYVFGTASLAGADGSAVSSPFMAAVMIGGMVPPVAIAIATQCFRSKFTEKDRKSFVSTFVMGLAFITEGAIPFAAEDPMRVIPSCAIGAAVAGALSMYFGCSVPAPHGGIFVFGVVQNTGMYLVSLAVGSVVGAVLLGVLKKKV